MQKVWRRQFDGWWYLTLSEGGTRQQIKLVKGPDDRETKAAAERQAVQALAARQHAEASGDQAPAWATAGHVTPHPPTDRRARMPNQPIGFA